MYEVELTTMYRQHYQRLNSKFQRFAREAQEILKESLPDAGRLFYLLCPFSQCPNRDPDGDSPASVNDY
jgi:hypothetical protein